VNANAITALQAICKDLSSFTVHFHGVELTGAVFALLDIEVFTVDDGEAGDFAAIVKLFKSNGRSAFFADDLADD
jgi:hypothetical protein